ncbi:hypothetical protein sos41_11260 [Alphaproteobacteria bacterium SO-S41]|nr:hypothetical protein sos41_11260 [Alphaproteobacteria bacterium SO-S41]
MADVFISYKRRLRPVVEHLAAALRDRGVSVWFDARLEPGDGFSDEISREVRSAACVLVGWSNDAFAHGGDTNAWVRGEATIGRERGTLVSVQLEPTDFDPPWNMMHHESLVGWATAQGVGAADDPRWRKVLDAVGRKIGRPDLGGAVPDGAVVPARAAVRPYRLPWIVLGFVALLGIAGVLWFTLGGGAGHSPFRQTMEGYCRETPDTVVYDCACMAGVLERELDPTTQAIFLIIGKPGASADGATVNRLLLDAGYTQDQIDAADLAVPKAVAKVAAECPKTR